MSEAALDRLVAAQAAHLAALDGGDLDALESSMREMRDAVNEVRGAGAWRDRADLRARLTEALAQADAARARLNWLADATARRLDRFAHVTGAPRAQGYARSGRIA